MKINVGVFFGGVSCEHEIACISANQAINALDKDKYDIDPIYISKQGDMYTGDLLLDLKNYSDLDKLCANSSKVCLFKDGNKVIVRDINGLFKKDRTIDVGFVVVHGTNCEDGTIAGLLETLRLPYTCSDVLGGAVGQDKSIMKMILDYDHIPMVDWFLIYESDFNLKVEEYKQKANKIGYPLISKPANLGSSIGIEVIHNENEFESKVKECLKYDFKVCIEKMITSLKEVNISVLNDNGTIKVSAIEEVMKNDELLSFKDKYIGGSKSSKVKAAPTKGSKGMASTSRKVPADLSNEMKNEIEEYAKKAYTSLNAYGVVRIDFMIDKDNNKVYLNEINSIPGSLAFYLWKEVGIDFDKECDILIQSALKRYARKEKKTYSFESNVLKNR